MQKMVYQLFGRAVVGGTVAGLESMDYGMAPPLRNGGIDVHGCDVNSDRVQPLARVRGKSAPRARAAARSDTFASDTLSIMPETGPEHVVLPPAAWSTMRMGKVMPLPHCRPGDPAVSDAAGGLARKQCAAMLAHHCPVAAAKDLAAAVHATVELKEKARLTIQLRGANPGRGPMSGCATW